MSGPIDPAAQPGQLLFAGFEGTSVPGDLARLIAQARVGGVVLFARNVAGPEPLRDLVAELRSLAPRRAPLVVGIDQEGGRVQRLRWPWTQWPAMARLGERESTDETCAFGAALARELRDAGVDLNFAPIADVATRPDNPPIGDRSFASEPERVARHVAAFVAALQKGGVAACAKHFPGHGDSEVDSHVDLPQLDHGVSRLESIEWVPFRAAIEAGVACVMMGHLLLPAIDPERPATLSRSVVGLLRKNLGYDGLVVSDDLDMKAVSSRFTAAEIASGSIDAGVDVLLACRDVERRDALLRTLEETAPSTLVPSLRRLAEFKSRIAARRAPRGAPPYPDHRALAARLSAPPTPEPAARARGASASDRR